MYKMVLFCTLTYSLALECASNILVFGMALLLRIVGRTILFDLANLGKARAKTALHRQRGPQKHKNPVHIFLA